MFRRYDGMAENQMPEDIGCAILVACCPKDLRDYLDMSSDDLVSSDLRVKANTWIERKRDQQPKNLQQLVSKNRPWRLERRNGDKKNGKTTHHRIQRTGAGIPTQAINLASGTRTNCRRK